ncbi:MAG: ABC transporter ATP-binding protein [Treponema sp.]|nr:ABC transporter ATP-binding protein [Treponema sp.]
MNSQEMKIVIEDLCFDFNGHDIFKNFSLSLSAEDMPSVILGPSGCGKTTLLRLIAGLLPFSKGSIREGEGTSLNDEETRPAQEPPFSFIFQENRFLPWYTILENIVLPLGKIYGKQESRDRAFYFLEQVSLNDKAKSYPDKLSGGQRQRAAIARAFAYPGKILLLDEPFQSLDIPLRIELMDLSLALLEKEKRLAILVTHDPREAAYMGKRVIILGQPPLGIVFDEVINLSIEERGYGSAVAGELEKRLIEKLKVPNP